MTSQREMDNDIERADRQVRFLREAKRRYKDVVPGGQVDGEAIYVSWDADADMTNVEFVANKKGIVYVYTYLELDGLGRIYSARKAQSVDMWLHDIRTYDPSGKLMKAMTSAARRAWQDVTQVLKGR